MKGIKNTKIPIPILSNTNLKRNRKSVVLASTENTKYEIRNFRLLSKQSAPIEFCLFEVTFVSIEVVFHGEEEATIFQVVVLVLSLFAEVLEEGTAFQVVVVVLEEVLKIMVVIAKLGRSA